MIVDFIFRSKELKFFSIERVFELVIASLPSQIQPNVIHVKQPGFSLSNLLSMRRYANSTEGDHIYHITGDIHYVVFAFPRERTVLTVHDSVFLTRSTGLKRFLLKKIFLDWPIRYVSKVTVVSEKTKKEILEQTGCDEKKLVVINNPVTDTIKFCTREFNILKPVLLFIGSTPNKNLERVAEALRNYSCTLHIIGQLSLNQIEKLNAYKIDYCVEQDLNDADLAERYATCDIVMYPSLYEGFGMPIIEGFKAGRAVLTSAISPMKDLAEEAGWLVDPYDVEGIRQTVFEIVNNRPEREFKIERGRKLAEKYLPKIIANQYCQVYHSLMHS